MSKSFMPAATNTITRSYYKTSSAPLHPEYGAGLRVNACQFLTSVDATSGKADGFASGVASIAISPDSIGGPMSTDARNYSYYAFRALRFHFISNEPSTDTFRQAFAYFPDSAIASFATVNFSTMQSTQDSVVTSRRQNCTLVSTPYTGAKVWFTEIDSASSASLRQTEQGVLYSFLNANETTTHTSGEVLIEYVLDLYGRSPDYAFTMAFRDAATARRALRCMDDNKVEICKRDRARLLRCLALRGSSDTVLPAAVCISAPDGKTRCSLDDSSMVVSAGSGGAGRLEVNLAAVGDTDLKSVYVPVNICQVATSNVPDSGVLGVVVHGGDDTSHVASVTSGGHLEVKTNVSCSRLLGSVGEKERFEKGEQNPGTAALRQLRIDATDSKYRERINVDEEYVRVPPSTPQRPLVAMKRQETK